MLNKKTVKAQCRKQFKEPLSSTQYIAFQKSHPEFPSYLRLKNLYGSWDAFCLSTWGRGAKIRNWSPEEAKAAVLKVSSTSLSSTAYLSLRSEGYAHLPTYNVLRDLFGSWPEVCEAVWGEKREFFKDWNQLEEMKTLILQSFSEPISSSAYAKERKEQQLPLPSLDALLDHFQTWDAVRCWLWQTPKHEWTKESIREVILNDYPARLSSTAYDREQKEKSHLPIRSTIVRFYGSWRAFSEETWGKVIEPTTEDLLRQMKAQFPTPPTQKAYEQAAAQSSELLSIHRLEKRFGSWKTLMKQLYPEEGVELNVSSGKYHQYSTPQLIRVVRRYFKTRPSSADYYACTKQYKDLPAKSTLVHRFGDWTTAMETCFPDSLPPAHANNWNKDQIRKALQPALRELASLEVISRKDYSNWRLTQTQATPSVSTIVSYFGSFQQGLREAGYTGAFKPSRSQRRARDEESLRKWLTRYWEQLDGRPTTQSYLLFQKEHPEAPTLSYLIQFYGTWKAVVEKMTSDWEIRATEIYSEADLKKALQFAYQSIGIPMTYDRYDQFRKTCEKKLPSSGSISRRFKTWRTAIEAAGIPYVPYSQTSRYQLDRVIHYEEENGLQTLEDVLNWALEG